MARTKATVSELPARDRLTIEEFLGYVGERPDGERWELIEGVAVLNASPSDFHQLIVANLIMALGNWKVQKTAPWYVLPGVGTRVPASPHSLPAPDVMVKENLASGSHVSEEALALFEVMSPSNRKADREWRLSVYRSILNCQHYVTIAQNRVHVLRHDRANDWRPLRLTTDDAVLELPALGDVRLPLKDIYRWTALDQTSAVPKRRTR